MTAKDRRFHWSEYHYNVNWSTEDQCYIGGVVEFPLLHAHAGTFLRAHSEIVQVVIFALENLRVNDEPVPYPEGWIRGRGGAEGGDDS